MIRVAVTGGIACGKSTVGMFLEEHGVAVCDADALAHAEMVPGSDVLAMIATEFGADVLGAEGQLDRRRLGERVFGSDVAREKLNAIVHPAVRRALSSWLDQQRAEVVAALVPLLYEAGFEDGWDATVCVWAPLAFQVQRLAQRDLTREQALARIRAQLPQEDKARMSDYVLVNGGTRALLRHQVAELMKRLMTR
jgi:dephospho-CoA kinase